MEGGGIMSDSEAPRRLIKLAAEILNFAYSSKAPTSYLDDWEFEFWPEPQKSRVPAKLRREIIERCEHMESKLKDWGYELGKIAKDMSKQEVAE